MASTKRKSHPEWCEKELSEINEVKDGQFQGIELRIEALKLLLETRVTSCLEEMKNENEILEKQIQYLGRQARILLRRVSR